MANVSNVSFRIDSDLKAQADALFSQLGMNMTTAFNIFLRQSVRENCIPFSITLNVPNADTISAIDELEAGGGQTFTGSTADLFKELMK